MLASHALVRVMQNTGPAEVIFGELACFSEAQEQAVGNRKPSDPARKMPTRFTIKSCRKCKSKLQCDDTSHH